MERTCCAEVAEKARAASLCFANDARLGVREERVDAERREVAGRTTREMERVNTMMNAIQLIIPVC